MNIIPARALFEYIQSEYIVYICVLLVNWSLFGCLLYGLATHCGESKAIGASAVRGICIVSYSDMCQLCSVGLCMCGVMDRVLFVRCADTERDIPS